MPRRRRGFIAFSVIFTSSRSKVQIMLPDSPKGDSSVFLSACSVRLYNMSGFGDERGWAERCRVERYRL